MLVGDFSPVPFRVDETPLFIDSFKVHLKTYSRLSDTFLELVYFLARTPREYGRPSGAFPNREFFTARTRVIVGCPSFRVLYEIVERRVWAWHIALAETGPILGPRTVVSFPRRP